MWAANFFRQHPLRTPKFLSSCNFSFEAVKLWNSLGFLQIPAKSLLPNVT
jgi:hypothetical protein